MALLEDERVILCVHAHENEAVQNLVTRQKQDIVELSIFGSLRI